MQGGKYLTATLKENKEAAAYGTVNHIERKYMPLVAGILEQAEYDFKKALRKKDSHDIEALKRWFLSDWGQALSDGNGQLIIDRIENEIKKERENYERGIKKTNRKYINPCT